MQFVLKHRDTPENNKDTPFEFTMENKKVIIKHLLIAIFNFMHASYLKVDNSFISFL